MSAIFISHSSKDSAAAIETKGWLDERGFRSLFLDFDPELGIPAGRNWEQELYRQLRACQAVVVLCSEHSMESDWCFVEITYARALGKLIFPFRVAPCTVRPPLTELQVVDAVLSKPDAFERLLQGLKRAGLENVLAWDPKRPPYPGLMTFEEADAAVFFGREADVRATLDALNRLRRFGGVQLAVFLGASGSGKSSLLRAGVLPRLKQNPETWLVAPTFRPQQRPVDEMAMALARMRAPSATPDGWSGIAAALRAIADGKEPAVAAAHLLRDLRHAAGGGEKTIVFAVDQFEEALVASEEAARFLSLLAAIVADPDRQAVVLATLRSDFLSTLQTHPALQSISFDTLPITHLSVDGLVQVIEGPAQLAGLELETGLTQLMLADAATDDSLPLLAFTLRELWEHDGKQGRLSVATYRDALGGLNGAIARAAEAVVSAATLSPQQERDLRTAFLAMVRINDAGQYMRQPARWADLPAEIAPLLERFVAARLLVASSQEKERIVEVAHEALFRVWRRARDWLDADRDNLRLRDGLRQAAREWNERGRPLELLVHRGSRLEAAEALSNEPRFPLDAVQREYLRACVDVREVERAAELRQATARKRRVQIAIATLSLGLLIVSALSVWAVNERKQATDRLANLHWVNGVTERERNDDLKALHHFTQAMALARDATEARNAQLAAEMLSGNATLAGILDAPDGVHSAAFIGDGARAVTWSGAGTARVWDVRAGGRPQAQPLHEGTARKIVQSPRGTRVVLWFGDDAIEVRDTETGRALATAATHSGLPVFSESETRLAIVDQDVAKIWDQSSDAPVASLPHPGRVLGAVLSRRGERALTWDERGDARLWDVDTGEKLAEVNTGRDIAGGAISGNLARALVWGKDGPLTLWTAASASRLEFGSRQGANPYTVGATFFSQDSRILTWNYGDVGVARVWDAATGKELAQLRHDATIRNAAFNREQTLVLTWSDDGTARVWDAAGGKQRAAFEHDDEVRGAVFSDDETRILTWSDDGSARVWDAANGQPLSLPLRHEGAALGAAFASDGRMVLTWGERTARLWRLDAEQERRMHTLVHRSGVLAAAFAPAAGEIVTLTRDGRLHHWSADQDKDGEPTLPRKVVGASFDRDGERIAGWSSDHTIGIWSARNAHDLVAPMRHERSDLGIQGVVFSADGKCVVSWGDDKTARIWDSGTGKLRALLRHPSAVSGAVPSDDQRQALTWSIDRVVRLWNVDDAQQPVLVLPTHEYGVEGAALTHDKARILTWDANGTIRLWDARTGALSKALADGAGLAVRGATFNADDSRILVWDERSVRIWDSRRDTASEPIVWDAGNVHSAAFNADESRVLTVGEEGARLWSVRSGQPLTKWLVVGGPMKGALLSNDERMLIAWTDTSLRTWKLSVGPLPAGQVAASIQQVRTGTRLGNVGQVELLAADEWRKLREQQPAR